VKELEAVIQQLVEKGVRYDAAAQEFEKTYIHRVLERVKGNQSRAARMLGMHRNTLSRKIAEYSLSVDFRQRESEQLLSRAVASRPSGRAMQVAAGGGRVADSGLRFSRR